MNNELAITIFLTINLNNQEHFEEFKERFKKQYNTDKVILYTGAGKDGIIITNLKTNKSTVL